MSGIKLTNFKDDAILDNKTPTLYTNINKRKRTMSLFSLKEIMFSAQQQESESSLAQKDGIHS